MNNFNNYWGNPNQLNFGYAKPNLPNPTNPLSQEEMANKLEISRPHYSDIENGKVTPSIDFGYKIQEVFEVDDVMELLKKE